MVSIITALMLMISNVHAGAEVEAIKAQAGCYKVDYKFEETQKMDPNYPISSAPYHEWGTEWIELDLATQDEVHLQHILITPHGPLKHWRQEWQKNPTQLMSFKGDNTWKTEAIQKPAADLWVQKVFQVDDSPRYECASPWTAGKDGYSWNCQAWSPLPRREFSQRSDYNVLDRGNFVVLNSKGWIHFQYSDKVVSDATGVKVIAKEKGANTYTKIADSECAAAQAYWKENKAIWHDIQAMWKHIYSHHPDLKFKSQVNGKTMWMSLFELADVYAKKTEYDSKALQKEAHDVIHTYFENHDVK